MFSSLSSSQPEATKLLDGDGLDWKRKEKKREQAENASNGVYVKKQSAGELRLHKGGIC
ncbi:hypothetical protein MtrunA17_Chr2g0313441 [Medicago truncatula]|uniref:Uncharacterized protein n=1 Tax=Medicago truncatula TaxID=3880 RepID=A0A396J8Y3_MEDTR|nr:hypothetical protein MtrunA17_Chr2g0313441 [Medicago truncatula]